MVVRRCVHSFSIPAAPKMAPVKRHAYEADFKLNAISHAVQHGNRAAAREFNINESMVRKWRKQEDALHQVKKTKLSFRGNKARWPQLEDKIEQWVIEQRTAGRSVSTVSIRLKATAIARDMEINDFRGGPSWCFRFMKRRNLSIRTRTTISQQLPKDYEEKMAIFHTYCKNKINEKKIRPEHITNMDEVPLTFDIPVNRTVEKTGTSTVSIRTTGNEKSSFTVVLGCQANGQKLPPMVIFKRKTLPKEKFPVGVIIKANPKGWMDEEKMSEWLREVYVKRPDGFFHKSPSLLICDSMRAHLTDTVKTQVKKTNSVLAIIPGGLTKQLQPLDIGVNRSFKVKLRAAWEHWMTEGEHTFTKTGRQRRASYATICQWIVDAWSKVSVSSVIRAFRKAGIITEQLSTSNETDSDNDENDERDPGVLDAEIAQLLNSDTEDEEFDGFAVEE
uniref:HTH CENPB-type domain-containing protein n=1 Tax=Leptobrachium leishanense TaxID=445787 RepID=A0A8C5PNZ8_9ANUR